MALDVVDPKSNQTKAGSQYLSQLKTAEDLSQKFEAMKRARVALDQQWKINLAYYKGRQYTFYSRASQRIEELPTTDGDKPRWRQRIVSNQIVTGTQSLISKYTKTKPVLTATPGTSDDQAVKAAQMAERLLEYWWDDLELDDKLEEALTWAIVAGQGYWKITWDAQAGKAIEFTLGPDGQPIADESLKTLYREELQKAGIPPEAVNKTFYLGDVKVEAMSPFDVYMDPGARTFHDAKYVICTHHMSPDEIKAKWGVETKPDSVPAAPDTTLPLGVSISGSEMVTKRVFIGYFLPQPALPKGRYVVWLDNQPQKILEDTAWPYPINKLPIVKFPGIRTPGSIYDGSIVETAIPMQKELNRTLSQIVEHKNMTIAPKIMAPNGSMNGVRMTNEPGAIYSYNPINGFKPEPIPIPSLPPYVEMHLNDVSARLRDVFSLTEVTEGQVPPNVEAGIAIDLLQEMATDRIAPTIKMIERSIAGAGQILLSLAQKYYNEPRLLKVKGSSGSPQVKQFVQADIAGGITVAAQSGSGLPRTRAGKQAQIEKFLQMGIISPQAALKHFDIADDKGLKAKITGNEDMAWREHEKIIQGIPISPLAQQDAMKAVQQQMAQGQPPMNPDTQQPFQSPQELQEYIEDQGWQPTRFEDWDTHLDIHAGFMASQEWESLPPEVQERFVDHFNATIQVKMSIPRLPEKVESVRTTLQLKGAATPTLAAKMLEKSGVIDASPQDATEPPMDTWVSDDTSKPDDPGASVAPIIAHQQALQQEQQMQHADQQAAAQQQQAHQQATQKQEQHNASHAQRLQQMSHAEELHQQKMRHADEQHKAALKQKAQKPKPNGG